MDLNGNKLDDEIKDIEINLVQKVVSAPEFTLSDQLAWLIIKVVMTSDYLTIQIWLKLAIKMKIITVIIISHSLLYS